MSDKYKTLWGILNEKRIEIPIIQRDYAQGRIGKEHLRERFLGKMFDVLCGKGGTMTLDFVYGTIENDALYPLDGQQRLTTLWLLHWYIALKSDNLSANKDIFNCFTYETRISSREFCNHLCTIDSNNYKNFKDKNKEKGIVEYIRNQTWFYQRYAQDPTVQGMLRTLGGTKIEDSTGNDIKDGLEEIFGKDTDFQKCWSLLTSEECPIVFVYKEMKDENLPLSDDLYVKMNARGKQLTDFENFKADLLDFAPDPDNPHKKLLGQDIASLMDNAWTDVFWNVAKAAEVYQVDAIYFKFIRDYLFAKFIADSSLSASELQDNRFYQDVYKGNNSNNEYTGFNLYKEVIKADVIKDLKQFFSLWQLSRLTDEKLRPLWKVDKDYFYLIPHYLKLKEGIIVSETTQIGRVVSYAVCRYFEINEEFDEKHFKDWLYFVWNVAENSNIATEDAMIGAIRLMKELSAKSGDILTFLASYSPISSKFAERQILEERFKARLMLGENSAVWRKKIREAESNIFLKGNISCLLRKDSEEYVADFPMFVQKFNNICKYFDSDGVKDEYQVSLTKALIACCHSFDQLGYEGKCFVFDTSADNWRQHLLNKSVPSYYMEVDHLLMVDDLKKIKLVEIEETDKYWAENTNRIKHILAEGMIVDSDIVFHGSAWRLNRFRDNVWALYPSRAHHAYVFDWYSPDYTFMRNKLFHQLLQEKKISLIDPLPRYPEKDGIYGDWNIFFAYNNFRFYWVWDNYIYLVDDDNHWIKIKGRPNSDEGENHYRLDMNRCSDISPQGFLSNLTKLAHEYWS
ncbi:DUF262 domain-containing protein [Segatella copri]|uniref:DUF262 domain-containing protein n=1 Tax=Segatella copri TaxID=165179 RepID=A0AA92UY33_9BACT|nr:DUF262 domain-containing protein [Segatella copri]RHA83287.1 DUF262 domain-containing protein [Segatella copri]